MRKLYVLIHNSPLHCISITDDGVVLDGHVCPDKSSIMHDLHDRPDRLKKIKAHFKDEPYEVEIVPNSEILAHKGLEEAFRIAVRDGGIKK